MALRLPTPEYLHQLVVDNYFELNQQELDALQELADGARQGGGGHPPTRKPIQEGNQAPGPCIATPPGERACAKSS